MSPSSETDLDEAADGTSTASSEIQVTASNPETGSSGQSSADIYDLQASSDVSELRDASELGDASWLT